MNSEILKRAEEKIRLNRQLAEDKSKQYFEKAYQNAEFKQLFQKQKELEIDIAKKQAYGEEYDTKDLQEVLYKQELILKQLGLNSSDLSPNYECVYCQDTGYINGKLCSCLKKEINKVLLKYSGFTEKLATFNDNIYHHPAFDLMQKWCEIKSDKTNIIISGHTGTGKTFLTQCIASEMFNKNKVVLFTTAFNLNNSMLNYHISFDSNRDSIINPFLTCEVLIIDDLGTEPMLKNVTKEYLYLILNERILNKLPTIITTNLDINDLFNTYGERITSRLINKKTSIIINLENEDLRMKKI